MKKTTFKFRVLVLAIIALISVMLVSACTKSDEGVVEKKVTVSFFNCKGALIETQTIAVNGDAAEPSDDAKFVPGYVFVKWDGKLTGIKTDTAIHGVYDQDTTNDTDGDGLSDYIESEVLNLDYSKADSDGNGVSDDQEDSDRDGIPNLKEIESSLVCNNPDTDGDGAPDGWEIDNNFDPFKYNESFTVATTLAVAGDTEISVNISELPGVYAGKPIVQSTTNESIKGMYGSIGEAIQYNVSAAADIKFSSKEIEKADDPVLMYFNPETNKVETIPVSISGDEATASITKYGNYALVDRTVFEDSGEWRDIIEDGSYTDIEIILVIDDSGSLGGDYGYDSANGVFTDGKDPTHKRLEVARDFIDSANKSAKIGIVKFDSNVRNMTNELVVCDDAGKETLKNYLKFTYNGGDSTFDSCGSTYMYGGIREAMTCFTPDSPETLKIVVVFTDGNAHDLSNHSSVVSEAKGKDIKIYTVGLGMSSSYFNDYLIPLAKDTNGSFYNADNAEQLASIYDNIQEKIDMEVDSDNDGLADFFESGVDKNGVPTLPTVNGMSFVGLDKNNPDTDRDGYKDGEEIEVYKYYSTEKPKQVMIWGVVNSNPMDSNSVPKAK
ncbi:MAG: VWA domain-containing protein [Ruminococcaceae bacterium]|nr:VWA domain-containing protein [Oscillospiraceae bacterium]